jgi:TPP-dependent pyruvate/acetoin dehydrogenase alpha subunit
MRQVPQTSTALRLFETMALIRAFEERVSMLFRDREIPGFVHTSLGQEATAAGIVAALGRDDYLTTTHRGHGHCLAKGMDLDAMMAELFGRGSGICHGKGGSMHVADPRLGVLGANAIVGASLPLAVGAGMSSKLLGTGRVAVAFFGEGAANQGTFHESLNLAAIWELPVIFACENNLYSEFTDSRTMTRVPSVAERAAAYGIHADVVDGNDAEAVHEVAGAAVRRCRDGQGPVLVEAHTYRWHGHYEGDAQPYKTSDEANRWRGRDPVALLAARLNERDGVGQSELDRILAEARDRVDSAVVAARTALPPPITEALEDVFVG